MTTNDTTESFVVTARKWRPQLFSEVVGQDHISTTLSNALRSNRVHHAYLFCGPRGVGKTTTARIFARALNCMNSVDGVEPCNECDSCRDILSGRSLDVIEIDGASNNSVDDIRKLRENAKYPPVHGKYKMYIIDEVHMLSTSAFNALLKTLEEPPKHLLFMFATTESHKVPATIVSRCQRFDFRRMQIDDIVGHLRHIATSEGISIDDASLVAIAKKGDGSMRDSQSIFDQVRAFCGETIEIKALANALHLIDEDFYFAISDAVREHNSARMFELVEQLVSRGYDVHECLHGLVEHFRNLMSLLATNDVQYIEASAASLKRYRDTVASFKHGELLRILSMISAAEQQLKYSAQPRFRFELLLVQLASLDSTVEIAQLMNELRESKKNGSKIGMMSAPVYATMPSPPARAAASAPASQLLGSTRESENTRGGTAGMRKSSALGSESSAKTPAYESKSAAPGMQVKEKMHSEPFNDGPQVKASVLQAGWSEFVKTLPQSLAAIKLCLGTKEVCAVRFFDGEVLILNTEQFMCDDLNARRVPFGVQLEKFFGSAVRIKVVHSSNISALPDQSADGAEQNNSSAQELATSITSAPAPQLAPGEKLPIESTLVELFGAKKIPLASN